MEKYYTNGLTDKKARNLTKTYAKVEKANYGLYDGQLQVVLGLEYNKYTSTFWFLKNDGDVKYLLKATHSTDVSDLEGKILQAYKKGSQLYGLSVGRVKKLKK